MPNDSFTQFADLDIDTYSRSILSSKAFKIHRSMNIVTYGHCDAAIRTNKDKVYKRSEIEQWSFWGPEQTLSPHRRLSQDTFKMNFAMCRNVPNTSIYNYSAVDS